MHPVLADRKRLALYIAAWMVLAFLLALPMVEHGRIDLTAAIRLTLPPTIFYAFICLAAWYPARALPIRASSTWQMTGAHLIAACVMTGVWIALFQFWSASLDRFTTPPLNSEAVHARTSALLTTGALLY